MDGNEYVHEEYCINKVLYSKAFKHSVWIKFRKITKTGSVVNSSKNIFIFIWGKYFSDFFS